MAGFFSEEIVSEVMQANDIVDIVSGYVRVKRAGNSLMGCCPFHREKTPSFHVSADKQLYHCFGCGANGDIITFVEEYFQISFKEAVKKGNVSKIVISKDDEVLLNLPVNVGIIGTILAPWAAVAGVVAALVKSTGQEGVLKVYAHADGLKPARLEIEVAPSELTR